MMNTQTVKVFFLNKKVLFPHCTTNVSLRHSAFSESLKKGDKIIAFPIRNLFDILLIKNRISTIAEIVDLEAGRERIILHLKGITRVYVKKIKGIHEASYEIISSELNISDPELLKELRKKAQELVFLINVEESDRLIELMNFLFELGQITDFIANYFVLDYKLRIELLNNTDIKKRSIRLLTKLNQLIKKME
ncbi:MAG TPA: LON peptidase substrate-binding domain-containing protein [Spirochaetota bacterium]|nr:LON peptidase substrate-binding domain-containing protein [Spirochaetota bacterium]HPS86638.1 LON peptidase substrate-binding domain-containing protein [Spirochaetota bacterium]